MISQSFLYNAIFFTYALVLGKFYGVAAGDRAALLLFAFAVGNLLGPLTLGRLFDTVGRQAMIAGTYVVSGRAARDHRRSSSTPGCSTLSPRRSPGA